MGQQPGLMFASSRYPWGEALECQILDQILKMQPSRLCWVGSGTRVGIREDSSAESPPG